MAAVMLSFLLRSASCATSETSLHSTLSWRRQVSVPRLLALCLEDVEQRVEREIDARTKDRRATELERSKMYQTLHRSYRDTDVNRGVEMPKAQRASALLSSLIGHA
jgi:hypothetical protein